jgi:hypothetical protein
MLVKGLCWRLSPKILRYRVTEYRSVEPMRR